MALQHIDTVITFVAVMLAVSLVITAGTQLAASLFGLRGTNLRRSLADLFETTSQDRDAKRYSKEIARRVLREPLISGSIFSRFRIRLEELPLLPADAAGKLRWAGSGIPFLPWMMGALAGSFIWPIALVIIKRILFQDFCRYSDLLTSYVPVLNLCEHPWRSGAIIGAVFVGLLNRWRLATSIRVDELVALLEKLSTPADGTLPDPAQRAMLVIAGEATSRPRPKPNALPAQIERIFPEMLDDDDGGVAVAVEKPVTQISAHMEPQLEGLNSWFDHAMERASQRFTMQARVITVVLSFVLVFAAHLDAVRLFQMLSSDAQVRAQLAGSADAIIKQAEQLPRVKEGSTREVARTAVPEVYRKAMVVILTPAPAPTELPRPKARHSSRGVAAEPAGGSQPLPNAVQALAGEEAKARAAKALETRPGFASREDAVIWLRATLDGDPALENLIASYEQEVNTDLTGDADKLIDHSASIKRELARTELQLIPGTWQGWKPADHELPGLLVALVFLCLGAPFCYNMLKSIASLRPLSVMKQEKRAER